MRGILCKYNQNIEKKIGHQAHIYCLKRKEWVPVYKCSKTHCNQHAFKPVVSVNIPVGRCDQCPYHYTKPTPNAGYAEDYFCKIANKAIGHYIEWDSEIPAVPDWCPFRLHGKTMEGV